MVHCTNLLTLLLLPALALCAPRAQRGGWGGGHGWQRPSTEVTYTTTFSTYTIWTDNLEQTTIVAPSTEAVVNPPGPTVSGQTSASAVEPTVTASVDPPVISDPTNSVIIDPIYSSTTSTIANTTTPPTESDPAYPSSTPSTKGTKGTVTFKNNCPYDVWAQRVNDPNCPGAAISPVPDSNMKAGATWSEPLVDCPIANQALKVHRMDADDKTPMQYEYGWKTTYGGMGWYNLSLKDCVNGTDFSACAGENWRISSTGPSTPPPPQDCRTYECNDYSSCCEYAGYCDAKATAAQEEPVSGCLGQMNEIEIHLELC